MNDNERNAGAPAESTGDRFTTYTLDETAKILRVSKRTLFNYLKQGRLHGFKIGRTVRITPTELDRFIAESQENQ